jgi:hypothetical protein
MPGMVSSFMNKNTLPLPEHSPMSCVVKTPAFRSGQTVALASSFPAWKGLKPGERYAVVACQTHGYPYGLVTDLVLKRSDGSEFVAPCVSGVIRR